MSNVKNRDMRHLLSLTEEDIKTAQQIAYDELRQATWSTTSVRDDMRRMSTQRLLHELRAQVQQAAYDTSSSPSGFSTIQRRVDDMLHNYMNRGSLQGYDVESITYGPDSSVTMSVNIVPTATVERINMEVRLAP